MRKLEFIKKLGFIIGITVLLMAVMPMSDGLAVQAQDPDWYYKPGNWTDYALSGMPDFDQKQDTWFDPTGGGNWSYCGPVAVANSLWWFDSANDNTTPGPPAIKDNYTLVTSYNPGGWDDHAPQNVEPLVNELAYLMDTDGQRTLIPHSGTDVMDMQWGIDMYLINRSFYGPYYEKTVLWPDFYEFIEPEVERCEDVVLLLGFYQSYAGYYERIGGHYVTCAGVNSNDTKLGLSDPYWDNAEAGFPGRVIPLGHNHTANGTGTHNDTLYVSHDTYDVVQVFPMNMAPCWALPNYTLGKGIINILNFAGQNGGPSLPGGAYNQQGPPIETIIDYAVAVSPKPDINDVIDSDYNWTELQEGGNVTITVHVTNETWNNTIYDMDILFWTDLYGTEWVKHLNFTPPLKYCQNYTFTVWYPFPPEIVVLHFSNYWDENIGFAFSYPEGALPDLVVPEKWETVEGCSYWVNYMVQNVGNATAGNSTTCIYADGLPVATAPCPALLAGEGYTDSVGPLACPGGTTVWIGVEADNYNDVIEENEDNNYYENVMEQPLEFGDAPDPTYPSLLASDGSRHCPTTTELLGLGLQGLDCKDFELDARVIDNDTCCDGLVTTFITANDPAETVTFEVTNFIPMDPLIVNILIDLNIDGDWTDAGEHVVQNQPIPLPGPAEGTFVSMPFSTVGATPGPTWLRLTLTRTPVTVPWNGTGLFECGETEDWNITIEEGFYWKPGNWTDYAPSGMPDFDQKQDNWFDPAGGAWTYCGPVAVANSLWYFDSREETGGIPPPTISDSYGLVTAYGAWDDHNVTNVEPLINDLASLMNTSISTGTDVFDMEHGIREYLNATGYNDSYYEVTVEMPDFYWIEEEVERCEDVILLLGFWTAYDDYMPPNEWWRVGGHYVTCAGVNSAGMQLGISDPFLDNAEAGGPGRVPVPHPAHPGNGTVHNDTQYVSHDIYDVNLSFTPGGMWALENYGFGNPAIVNFQGLNPNPNSMLPVGPYLGPQYPLHVEIEYAVAVSPIAGAVLDGHVDLEGRPATNVTVRLFQCDTTTEVDKVYGTTDASGNFTVSVSVSGTYDIGVKGQSSLSNLVEDVDLSAGGRTDFGLLREGEANGDDYISGGDYSLLSAAWMTWPGKANWDASVDFTRDSYISGGDYALLSYYWMDLGDCYGWPGDWN